MTTLHANTPRDSISRIETMALMGGIDFPIKVIREQISSAVELFVQQTRLRDGTRKITHLTEIAGMEGDRVVLQDIFRMENGQLRACGLRPHFLTKLETAGIKFGPEAFMPSPRR
jgi:pilus assembly protein CpaF